MPTLTHNDVKNAAPKEKQYKLGDSGGLFLLVKPNGGKYWRMKYRFMGKEKLLSIGVFPEVTLKAARKARDEVKALLESGQDPSLAKQLKQQQRHQEYDNSFAALAAEWHTLKSTSWAPITAKRQQEILNNDLIPYLGRRPVGNVETFELVGVLTRILDRGALETAHRPQQRHG